jgi:membrane peptidoglycan carboxypeptidase
MSGLRRGLFIAGSVVLFIWLIAGIFIVYELRTSRLQARYLSRAASEISFRMEPGPSSSFRFPRSGPYDERLGYTFLPACIDSLTSQGYTIKAQARLSPRMEKLIDMGLFPIYHEKTQTGLCIEDADGRALFAVSYPKRAYRAFDAIPRVVMTSLLFIENRELLDTASPTRNPAVEWDRLANTAVQMGIRLLDHDREVPGGSSLATQIEKFRHSPEGLTSSAREKIRQMASASLRAYLDGEKTLRARRRIILDYVNSLPLGAVAGYGEVIGLGDGLWGWYREDFEAVNQILSRRVKDERDPSLPDWGRVYKEAMSLFLATRRPSFYLIEDPAALEEITDEHLNILAGAGVISPYERDAALGARLQIARDKPAEPKNSFVERKAANAIRPRLLSLLDVPQLYILDRFDLTVKSTLDSRMQEEVTKSLRELGDRSCAAAAGLYGEHLLEDEDPSRVIYSFTLYERRPGANVLRAQTDNFDQPLSINENTKLELGSSAKLRTLITYCEIIASLHDRYASLPREELRKVPMHRSDRLGRWAIEYLAGTQDTTLAAMLEAALKRRYSADPEEEFFTGGGLLTFSNFKREDDDKVLSVREAFRNSVNLVFIRLMQDVVQHYIYRDPESMGRLLEDSDDPRRLEYLKQYADLDGKTFLKRFYRKYHGKPPEEALALLVQSARPTPTRLAIIFRSVAPEAGIEQFASFLLTHLPSSNLSKAKMEKLYNSHSPEDSSLEDRGYQSRVHPLELWTAAHLRQHPDAHQSEFIAASADVRKQVYGWLYGTHRKGKQDDRIRIILEIEAFEEIHQAWKRLGYPFESLVPSYATAIGSSADRPAALAELVGIVVNDGVRYPSVRFQELHFAEDTPYETILERPRGEGEQVLPQAVARTVRKELVDVVEQGTAVRLRGAFRRADGSPAVVGGKTGTGDNRFEVFGAGGKVIRSQVTNRTAAFVFMIDERYFGAITAYVAAPEAVHYSFTSSLPVQVLKVLAPRIMPFLEREQEQTIVESEEGDTMFPSFVEVEADTAVI